MNPVQPRTVPDLWVNNLVKFPRKTAAIYEGAAWTYQQAEKFVEACRAGLARRFGVKQGDKVVMAMPNCFEFFVAYWATIKLGGVVVPVNIRLRPEGMTHVIGNSDARVLIVHKENWPVVKDALRACPNIKHVVSVGFQEEGSTRWEDLLSAAEAPPPIPAIQPEDLVIIMHTSGTTGVPKGAMMRHADILFNIRQAIIAQSFRHEDINLLYVPMFHCTALYTMLPLCAYLGSTVVIAPRPDIRELVDLVEKHRVTTFLGVPTLFYFLTTLSLEKRDLKSLRLIAYAGSPMPPQTIRRLREKFPTVALHNFFGLTETISMTHVLPSQDATVHPDSIGKLLPEVFDRIVDENGNDVKPGEVGELCFHRSNVVTGYWKRPDLLPQAMIGDWFRTGDLATKDADGYVYLKGRRKDMIIVGGENVYALEVENVILSHPKVLEVAVVGIEATGIRAYLGELVKAVVVPKPGEKLTDLEIKKHCAGRLTSYQMPQAVEFREKLPRNPAGKVLKQELK
ncbi:MAG: long-chain fatty acid--CoA ligase [Planctomycetes bacterium]|nr:long-chain fatty acid--CoA ligase [Planctomycetota bacterium]